MRATIKTKRINPEPKFRSELRLPKIGETVNTAQGYELCLHYGLFEAANQIRQNPEAYKPWVFDGVSVSSDELLAKTLQCDVNSLVYDCALPHDLAYAYGEAGDEPTRLTADTRLRNDLEEKANVPKWLLPLFFYAVRVGGGEWSKRSFSWGFARKVREPFLNNIPNIF